MAEKLAEFTCLRIADHDKNYKTGVQPADLHVRVWNNNLVTFDFCDNAETLNSYRLCWQGFRGFIECVALWLFGGEGENEMVLPSCIKKEEKTMHVARFGYDLMMMVGAEKPECCFIAPRMAFLSLGDEVMKFLDDLPEAGCFLIEEADKPVVQVH